MADKRNTKKHMRSILMLKKKKYSKDLKQSNMTIKTPGRKSSFEERIKQDSEFIDFLKMHSFQRILILISTKLVQNLHSKAKAQISGLYMIETRLFHVVRLSESTHYLK
jgi:hypothetical protein